MAGLAPFNYDSGKMRGGRAAVLYMAAIDAIRFNPVIGIIAERLEKDVKRGKVIIPARMRKLLGILNSTVRERLTWNQLKFTNNRLTSITVAFRWQRRSDA